MCKRKERDLLVEKRRYDARADGLIHNNEKGEVKNTFEVISDSYDPKYRALLEYRNLLEMTITHGSRVLELGAGMGENTEPMLSKNCDLYLLDISEISLIVAKRRWGTQIKVVLANIEELPFSENFFDFVVGAGCLSYGDPKKVDQEISRVLKPGGSLILVDSLNHNPIYILNRVRHLMSRNRSFSTILRIPKMKRIEGLAALFELNDVQFFGIYLWLHQLSKMIFGRKMAATIYNFFESKSKRKRFAFKFVFFGKDFKSL
jgi:ubiquinone/menaquinone biosynthesis C-methylase UbiE